MSDSLTIPEFLDSFNPDLARRAVLAQLTTLNAALASARRIDSDLPFSSRLISTLEFAVQERQTYLTEVLPHMLAWRAKLRELASIDERLTCSANSTTLTVILFVSLKADETYHTFKFLAGKICKLGWKLIEGKADHTFGSVDFSFTTLGGRANLRVCVKPGESATCQLQEQTETREVVVRKIICGGEVAGEMSDAKLTQPQAPSVPSPAPKLTKDESDEIPF